MKTRGQIRSSNRVTVNEKLMSELGLKEGDFYEMETHSASKTHPKILITFFKSAQEGT